MMALAVTIAAVSQHGNGDGETDTFSKQQLEEQWGQGARDHSEVRGAKGHKAIQVQSIAGLWGTTA